MTASGKRPLQYDCAILGAGPAGLVSALYLSRFKRRIVVIDSGHSRAQWIPKIKNLIGYGSGLDGLTLLRKLKAQVHLYKNDWIRGEGQIYKEKNGFEIRIGKRKVKARSVILATGMQDCQPPVSNIPELRRKAVLAYCPICDGYEYSDQEIGLLVRDLSGLKKIKSLSRYSRKISVFQINSFSLSPYWQKKIALLQGSYQQGKLEWMKYQERPKGILIKLKGHRARFVRVAYVALGVDFNTQTTKHLKGFKRTKEGFILTKSHQETSVPGLYAVGDCVNALAQVSVGIGQAALAATRIHNRLKD